MRILVSTPIGLEEYGVPELTMEFLELLAREWGGRNWKTPIVITVPSEGFDAFMTSLPDRTDKPGPVAWFSFGEFGVEVKMIRREVPEKEKLERQRPRGPEQKPAGDEVPGPANPERVFCEGCGESRDLRELAQEASDVATSASDWPADWHLNNELQVMLCPCCQEDLLDAEDAARVAWIRERKMRLAEHGS